MRSSVPRRWLPLTVLSIVGGLGGIWAASKDAPAPAPVRPIAPPVAASMDAPIAVARASGDVPSLPSARSDAGGTAPEDEGLAALIDRLAPRARRGDADAAYRVYRAEALCGSIDGLVRLHDRVDAKKFPSMNVFFETQLAEARRACMGVTPVEIGERFVFLEQAIRAGNRDAMRAYRFDQPTGVDVYRKDDLDPRGIEWRRNAHAYLETLAGEGDRLAWSLLGTDYRDGLVIDQDLGASLRYQVAYEKTRQEADRSTYLAWEIDRTAAMMPPEQAEAAMAQGSALAERFPARTR